MFRVESDLVVEHDDVFTGDPLPDLLARLAHYAFVVVGVAHGEDNGELVGRLRVEIAVDD